MPKEVLTCSSHMIKISNKGFACIVMLDLDHICDVILPVYLVNNGAFFRDYFIGIEYVFWVKTFF